jgi:hypothetical protein
MKSLERRIRNIEAQVIPQLPCPVPGHDSLRIFTYGITPEQDRENDALLESIKQCKYCISKEANGERMIMMFRTLAETHDNPSAA